MKIRQAFFLFMLLSFSLLSLQTFARWPNHASFKHSVGLITSAHDAFDQSGQQNSPAQTSTPTPKQPHLTRRDAKEEDAAAPIAGDDEVVRVESSLTNLFFNAIDREKRFVTTLRQEDLRVLEDGVPQTIFTFGRQTDLSLSLAILIDTSMSQERTLPDEKRAARDFVISVIRPQMDRAAVISFTGEATLEQEMTNNKAKLQTAISQTEVVTPDGYVGGGVVIPGIAPPRSTADQNILGSTAIWDAVWVTCNEVLNQAPERTRKAIILLTDGDDTSSRIKSNEAIDQAIKADAVIYAIGIGDSGYNGIDKKKLRKVAEKTGGRAFFPQDENELHAAFTQIEQELRTQYLLAYTPVNKNLDGGYRQVKIEVINPELRKQNLRLTYREGYYARAHAPARRASIKEQP